MILRLLIVNWVKCLIIFDDKFPAQVRKSHISLCIVFHNWIKPNGHSSNRYEAFNLLWVFRAKHCYNASSKRVKHKNSFFKSTLLYYLVDFLACALHRHIKKSFLGCLFVQFLMGFWFEKWWTIVNNFPWEFKANEFVLVWRNSSNSYEQVVSICESYLFFPSSVIDFRKFFSQFLSNRLLRIWSIVFPVFWVFPLFLSFAHLKIF